MEKKYFQRKRVCRFCTEKIKDIDYKDTQILKGFVTDRGKIIPRRISGNCAGHQRQLTRAIKRARNIAFLAFAEER
ncbi:MAG: 30S ribosomal protein S18 [Nitrospira sp.]|nr:30S ribosomal protein S18 [Candidatus Manganitrophaceae bacterium]HIL35671.1 30S ribosomal protein S18 [Candidatus Manganitrophaceae bacterium]